VWITSWLKCRICSYTWVGVQPFHKDALCDCECPTCGNMTGDEDATD